MLELPEVHEYSPYAGIGSRATPPDICELMTDFAHVAEQRGYTLRSGAAEGADTAFEEGVKYFKEIFLPWPMKSRKGIVLHEDELEAAMQLAANYYPRWQYAKYTTKLLMARNGCQVLGYNLNMPSKFVICWTPDGKAVGGTSQAIHIAEDKGIPVYNLALPAHRAMVEKICLI